MRLLMPLDMATLLTIISPACALSANTIPTIGSAATFPMTLFFFFFFFLFWFFNLRARIQRLKLVSWKVLNREVKTQLRCPTICRHVVGRSLEPRGSQIMWRRVKTNEDEYSKLLNLIEWHHLGRPIVCYLQAGRLKTIVLYTRFVCTASFHVCCESQPPL